mgnify:CR=1 FL=1
MYFIVNIAKKDIVISDMGLTIKVKQGIDLDNKNINNLDHKIIKNKNSKQFSTSSVDFF